MEKKENKKIYDLEERTFQFANKTRKFIRTLKKTSDIVEDCKQLLRSSSSVGANYIEANESLSKKDFIMRIKICRKESKESLYWLKLLKEAGAGDQKELEILIQESSEFVKIFNAIIQKSV